MSYNPMGGQTYTLQSSISSTQTTITLSSFTVPVSGDNVTMALMNTAIAYATISPKTSSSEFISFTGITQNSDGTATLTGVTRGLDKTYPYTENTDFKLPHAGQSTFILSDAPQVFSSYGAKANDEEITGYWEAPDPITAQGLVTRDYMLSLINGGTVSVDAVIQEGIAGETVALGNLMYFSETDNEWLKTDADTLATVFNVKLGIAMGAGVNGGAITGGVLTYGDFPTSGLTQGDLCYASNTAGGINSGTPGTVPRVIGIAKSTDVLYFDPNFQNTLYNYAVDSVGTDSYAVTMPGALSVPFVGMQVTFKAGTANTGACTLAVNGGSAIAIVKNVNVALGTGDILANQVVTVVYDGTNFQMVSPRPSTIPVINVYSLNSTTADSTTRFDITNPSGTTFRYTYDGTGTDPGITAVGYPIGGTVSIFYYSGVSDTAAANSGSFTITGSGANYFEVTNASGVAVNDVTLSSSDIGPGALFVSPNITWTKASGLNYIIAEVCGGGGGGGGTTTSGIGAGGGGGGGYSKEIILAANLGATETILVGGGGGFGSGNNGTGKTGGTSSFGSHLTATGGAGGAYQEDGGIGGIGSSGTLNIQGQGGGSTSTLANTNIGGTGGSSQLGGGGRGVYGSVGHTGLNGGVYGGGGAGASNNNGGDTVGGYGGAGVVIITEYYS